MRNPQQSAVSLLIQHANIQNANTLQKQQRADDNLLREKQKADYNNYVAINAYLKDNEVPFTKNIKTMQDAKDAVKRFNDMEDPTIGEAIQDANALNKKLERAFAVAETTKINPRSMRRYEFDSALMNADAYQEHYYATPLGPADTFIQEAADDAQYDLFRIASRIDADNEVLDSMSDEEKLPLLILFGPKKRVVES